MPGRETRIPIANIFYMLAYAWNTVPDWFESQVDRSDYETLWELLARLLLESAEGIFKRGLARDYVSHCETIPGVKGRLDPGNTVRRLAWHQAKTICTFDEFEPDIPVNQAIKATAYRMLRSTGFNLEQATKTGLKQLFQRLGEISLIDSGAERILAAVKLQRNQRHYAFPLALCKFILGNTVFNEDEGKYQFLDFERDHQKMSTLFEAFVINYYKKHLKGWTVRREIINWNVEEGGTGVAHLPEMRTDITLECQSRKIVIDTKFYQEPMISSFPGSPKKFASNNLYQLNAYLTNLEGCNSHPMNDRAEGMLLYPVLQPIERLDARMNRHRIRVESIDLNQEWRAIGHDLEALITEPIENSEGA